MTITVLGCGWLGFPLAQRLAGRNYRVKGSARSEKKVKLLNQNSIDGYRIELPDSFQDESAEPFWNSEILFLNIPPSGTGNPETYPGLMERAARTFMESGDQENKWVIFASSTSDIGRAHVRTPVTWRS